MQVTVCRPDELGNAETARWRQWQSLDRRLANPFLAPEFAIIYARHRPSARVAVIEDDGALVGFLPFEHHGRGAGRSLAYRLADCQAMICAPGYFPPIKELMARSQLGVLEFDHILAHQAVRLTSKVDILPSPVVDLSGGWAPWLVDKKKSTSRVKRTLEKERKLSREVGPITLVYDSREHLDLCQLMAWKSFQYTHTGRFDLFSQNWMRNFLHELLDTRVHNFSMRLSRLQAGSRTVALYLCTRSDTVLGSWFPTYDPRLASYSPGFISVLSLLEAAAGDGIRKVDLGKGHEGYKQTLKNGDDMIGQGVVTRFAPFTLWRDVYQAPRRFAFRLVNRSPRAYRAADATLRRAARARARLGRS